MVNFMCQPDQAKGCPEGWKNILSGCVWMSLLVFPDSKTEQSHSWQCGWSASDPCRAQREQKGGGGRAGTSELDFSGLPCQTEPNTSSPPGFWVFRLTLSHTAGSPGSLSSRQQIVGFLSLHNCVKQFPSQTSPIQMCVCVLLILFLQETNTLAY